MYYACSFVFKYTFSLSAIVWLLSSSTQASESEWVEVSEDDDDEENEDDDDDDESNSNGSSEENEDDDDEEEVPILIS